MAQHDSNMYKLFWTKLKRQVAIIFLTVILATTTLPVAIFILLPASLVLRLIAILIARAFRPDLYKIFRGKGTPLAVDSIYKRPDFNILLYMFCDNGPMPIEQFRSQFQHRVLNYIDESDSQPYEKLMQTWTSFMGFLFWKWDKNFKLENHIRRYDYTDPELALPAKCTEDDLKIITGELIAKPWVEGQSPWEILIVPDYRKNQDPEKTGSVAILRVHHAMIDGYSIRTMVFRLCDSLNVKTVLANVPKLSMSKKIWRLLLLAIKLPYDLAEFAVDSFDGSNCWHFLWKPLSRKFHAFFSDEIDVEIMKKIRKKYGVDYNSTVYSITAGSIRRLMLASGQELPESVSVCVPFPLPKHPGGLVFHTSCTSFKFCPRTECAKERIGQIGANLKSLKENPTGPTTMSWFGDILAILPIWLLRLVHYNSYMTVGMTSVPGPESVLPMAGESKLIGMCTAVSHTSKIGAIAGIVTMAGKQIITLTVDKAIFEGYKVPTRFAEFVNQEIEDLLN